MLHFVHFRSAGHQIGEQVDLCMGEVTLRPRAVPADERARVVVGNWEPLASQGALMQVRILPSHLLFASVHMDLVQ